MAQRKDIPLLQVQNLALHDTESKAPFFHSDHPMAERKRTLETIARQISEIPTRQLVKC